jgi:RimJ/RimL family protein N-acetyltransferase
MRLMDRQQPVTEAEHETWFITVVNVESSAYFAIETADEGAHIGNVWLWDIDRRNRKAEVRVVVGAASARGRGLGSEAIDEICQHGFERLGLHRLYAYVLAHNPVARRAFESAGFALEGTLRDDRWSGDRFVDTYLLARVNA